VSAAATLREDHLALLGNRRSDLSVLCRSAHANPQPARTETCEVDAIS